MLNGVRIAMAMALFLAGLLAVVKPPTYRCWQLSILVMEAGHFLVLPCLLAGFWSLRSPGLGKVWACFFLAAGMLYAVTALRAIRVSSRLAEAYASRSHPVAVPEGRLRRSVPISFRDLFLGIPAVSAARRTLAYGQRDGRDLHLDYYAAAPSGLSAGRRAACIVVIHGGGWDGGARTQLSPLNDFLAGEGYAVASLEYSLAPKYRYPAPVEDVAAALAFLKSRAQELGLDPGRFVVLGRSAGGQIALQSAYTLGDKAIKGAIAFYAPADMVFGYGLPTNPLILDSRQLMEQYLGGSYSHHPEAYVASSPVEHLSASSPPTLMLHGRVDELVSFQHSVHLRGKLDALGVPNFTVDLPWGAHGFDFVFRGPGSQISLYYIERFLAETL
jgi:acetyl esterase/lipase